MNKNLNKLVVSGLMAAAVFGVGFSNTVVNASALDQPTVSLAHVMSVGSNGDNSVNENNSQNTSVSVAHVMSTGSNNDNASNGSEGENASLSSAYAISNGSNEASN